MELPTKDTAARHRLTPFSLVILSICALGLVWLTAMFIAGGTITAVDGGSAQSTPKPAAPEVAEQPAGNPSEEAVQVPQSTRTGSYSSSWTRSHNGEEHGGYQQWSYQSDTGWIQDDARVW